MDSSKAVSALIAASALSLHAGLIAIRADERAMIAVVTIILPFAFYLAARTWHGGSYATLADRTRHALAALSTSVSTTIGMYAAVPLVGPQAEPTLGGMPLLGLLIMPALALFTASGLWAEARRDPHTHRLASAADQRSRPGQPGGPQGRTENTDIPSLLAAA